MVSIEDLPGPLIVGGEYSLTCTVVSDFPPTVQWLHSNNNNVINRPPDRDGNVTILTLTIGRLKTSHGGVYSCLSTIVHPFSHSYATKKLIVQGEGSSLANQCRVMN